jgi:hypothetical protein
MNRTDAFAAWVPDLPDDEFGPAWTQWAKPVLFASISEAAPPITLQEEHLSGLESEIRSRDKSVAIVVDLPGPQAARIGLAFARMGLRPVPLFNGSSGREELIVTGELIETLRAGGSQLQSQPLSNNAAPAFLLDSRRMSKDVRPQPGKFDNRWLTFPQDFPSANLLIARGVSRVIVIQPKTGQPAEDLAHVLRRWQDAGISTHTAAPESTAAEPIEVKRPARFRRLWYGVLALMGLMSNSAGGFGGVIPHPSAG